MSAPKEVSALWKGPRLDARTATDAERAERRLSTRGTIIEVIGVGADAEALVKEAVEYAYKKGVTTFDCETTGLDPFLDKIVLVQMGDTDRQYLIWWQTISNAVKARIKKMWCDPAVKKAGVNLKFDAKMLLGQEGLDWTGAGLLDCQIIEQILLCGLTGDIGFTMKLTGMGPMADRWLGLKLVKDEDVRTGWGELMPGEWGEGEDGRVKRNYAADDVPVPILLLEKQLPWIRRLELVKTLKLEMDFLPDLAEMEIRGLHLDREEWAKLALEAEQGLAKAERELDHLFDVTVTYRTDMDGNVEITRDKNYASKDQLKDLIREWMLREYGIEVIGCNKHLVDALVKAGMNPTRLERVFEAKMVPDPEKVDGKKKVGYPNMTDYIDGSEFVDSVWSRYVDRLPPHSFAFTDTESKTLKLLKIIHEHPNKDEIDTSVLPCTFGLPPRLVDPILAFRDNGTKLERYAWNWIGDPRVPGDHGIVHQATQRIHTDTTQAAADTGRLTTRPNFQNLPAKQAYRQCIRARPGYKMVGADFSQIEPRIIGEISNCGMYMRVFWSEKPGSEGFQFWCGESVTEALDLYGTVGAEIGVLPEDAARKSVAKLPENSKGRKKSKIGVLGLGYGQQKKKFYISYLLDMGGFHLKSESDDLFDGFWYAASEVKDALDALSDIAGPESKRKEWHPFVEKKITYSESLGGRKRFFQPGSATWWTQGRNHPIQSTGADILKETVVELSRWMRRHKIDGGIILTAHDELLAEVREDQADAVRKAMEQVMAVVGQRYCPHVPITAEGYVEDFWLKD